MNPMHLVSDPELETSGRQLETSIAKACSSTQSRKARGVTCTKLTTKGVCVLVCVCVCVFK